MKARIAHRISLVGVCMACGAGLVIPLRAAVSVEQVSREGFAHAWRLSNGEVDLVVVPEIGRIVRYGQVNGTNMLWSGRAPGGVVWLVGAWTNWGGDKVWVWPQDGWPARAGRAWAPPGDGPVQGWKVRAEAGLCMTGPEIEGHGCRAVREIALAPTGSAVTIVTRLEAIGGASLDGLSAWCVTQVPATSEIEARLAPDAVGAGIHDPEPGWPAPTREDRRLVFLRPAERGCKSFVDADRLSVIVGDLQFTEDLEPSSVGAAYRPGERAQLCTAPDMDRWRPPGVGPYIELEFTSRRASAGQSPSLTVIWTLRHCAAGRQEEGVRR